MIGFSFLGFNVWRQTKRSFCLSGYLIIGLVCLPRVEAVTQHDDFEVVIAGGSTAAFAAAISSAASGAKTALLEPTDWVGGQLTASAVPAIDEAWHTVKGAEGAREPLNVAQLARDPRNMTPSFLKTLQGMPHCGQCWVSRFCFRPSEYMKTQLLPLQRQVGDNLVVFLETVVKQVQCDAAKSEIVSLTAIRRTPRPSLPSKGYDRLPSQDIQDWYSATASPRFDKEVLRFSARADGTTVFVDATEWGEVLVLSGADFLQGVEPEDGSRESNDTCGQSTVFCFVQEFHEQQMPQTAKPYRADRFGFGDYKNRKDAWNKIWTYRRIAGQGDPGPGDLCLQNWGYSTKAGAGGNDYPFGYLFKSKVAAKAETADWQGGVDLAVMSAAEQRALGWHEWFRRGVPQPHHPDQITLNGSELGTGHGLAKLPYIRDTRRSIGLDGFVLKFSDLSGPVSQQTGTRFYDRIAIGAYPADVHHLESCTYPKFVLEAHDTLPFYVPFRALTHYEFGNLLVAGKTMAQSFLANSATRLHPIEWSSGTAAGVIAAHMAQKSRNSGDVLTNIGEVQQLVKQKTPIDWTWE